MQTHTPALRGTFRALFSYPPSRPRNLPTHTHHRHTINHNNNNGHDNDDDDDDGGGGDDDDDDHYGYDNQCAWRRHTAVKVAGANRAERAHRCAVQLQSAMRGFHARKLLRKLRFKRDAAAATKIQTQCVSQSVAGVVRWLVGGWVGGLVGWWDVVRLLWSSVSYLSGWESRARLDGRLSSIDCRLST
jgi:hypothetical protein